MSSLEQQPLGRQRKSAHPAPQPEAIGPAVSSGQSDLRLARDADVFSKAEELCGAHTSSGIPSSPGALRYSAIVRHKANVKLLNNIIQQGQHENGSQWGPAWPNSCKWLLSCKARIHALTPTHDSEERAAELRGGASTRAYFGIDSAVPDGGLYNDINKKDRANVIVLDQGVRGIREDGKIVIVDPSAQSVEQIKEFIVHEIQHEADHHSETSAFENYQSEFNAHWIANTFRQVPAETGSAYIKVNPLDNAPMTGFDNARQQAILLTLMMRFGAYPYVTLGWKQFSKFRELVLSMKSPKGINLLNSPRIDDLYLALTKDPPDIRLAKKNATLLTVDDRTAIAAEGMREYWWALIAKLPSSDREYFAHELGLPLSDGSVSIVV